MQHILKPHPDFPPASPLEIWASADHSAAFGAFATANIWFGIRAPLDRFRIAPPAEPERADELWQTTCFEAFLQREAQPAYREWNFAPTSQWAAYDFDAPRRGMTRPDIAQPPYIRVEDNLTWWSFGATIAVEADTRWRLGLTAVIEEADGTKSYWALAHGPGAPDFHNPDCFTARLP
jgi:hypothetical protein